MHSQKVRHEKLAETLGLNLKTVDQSEQSLLTALIRQCADQDLSHYSYRRKLKAAKAMNTASAMNSDIQKGGAMVPGTNKYTMEGWAC